MDITTIVFFILLPLVVADTLLVLYYRYAARHREPWMITSYLPGYGIYLYFKRRKSQS